MNIRLIPLSKIENKNNYIDAINKIAENYRFSKIIYKYDDSRIENLYLICAHKELLGFIEFKYENLDISLNKKPIKIFLNQLHISINKQRKGVGYDTLNYLLSKGVSIEMVVANENESMLRLVNKFNLVNRCNMVYKYTSIPASVQTVIISP